MVGGDGGPGVQEDGRRGTKLHDMGSHPGVHRFPSLPPCATLAHATTRPCRNPSVRRPLHAAPHSSQAEAQPMPGWRRIAGMPEVRGAWLRRCRIKCERRRMGIRGKKPHNERSARASTATREEGVHLSENWTRGHEAARGLVRVQDDRVNCL